MNLNLGAILILGFSIVVSTCSAWEGRVFPISMHLQRGPSVLLGLEQQGQDQQWSDFHRTGTVGDKGDAVATEKDLGNRREENTTYLYRKFRC